MKLASNPRTFGPSLMLSAGQIYALRSLAFGLAFGGFGLDANPWHFSRLQATGALFLGGFVAGVAIHFADYRMRRSSLLRAQVGPLSVRLLVAIGAVAGVFLLVSILGNLVHGRPWGTRGGLVFSLFSIASLQGVSRFWPFGTGDLPS